MFYRWTRDLHLYTGLFISPFLLLFAISVFFLNHAKVTPGQWADVATVQGIEVPAGVNWAQGLEGIAAARTILQQVGVDGEIGSARLVRQTGHVVIQVSKPGWEAGIDVDVNAHTATLSTRPTSLWETLAYLHKMPGPHNVEIRGNWAPTRIWRFFADTTVYLVLFITITGIYLWWALRAERRIGLIMLSLGLLTFVGCIHALLH